MIELLVRSHGESPQRALRGSGKGVEQTVRWMGLHGGTVSRSLILPSVLAMFLS